MTNNKDEIFRSAPIPKAVMTLALPSIISMLVTVIYNMADTFFVGQTNDANQVAAVSLAMPVFLLLMALGNMFGIGACSFISRLLGMGEREQCKKVSAFCFYGGAFVGILMIFVFLGGMPVILKIMGSSPNTAGFAEDYLRIIALGAPFVLLSTALGNVVRGEGAAKVSMIGMMLGTILNIILDPIMILSMNMGVAGAALATIIGNIATTVFYIFYLLGKNTSLSIAPKDFAVKGIIGGVLSIGFPASLNNILMSTANIILNNFLASYGDIPVASMGVAMKANMLLILLQIGLASGIQPLIGYCYGAKNFKRLNATIKFSLICTVSLGSVLTLAYFIFTEPIIHIFINDSAVISNGITMLRALMISGPFIGILFISSFSIQAMGKALASLIITISRQGFVFLPMLFILNAAFGLNGIIYAQACADVVAVFLAVFILFHLLRKEERKTAI